MTLPLDPTDRRPALPRKTRMLKRGFDLVVGLVIAPLIFPVVIALALGARISTGRGIFVQTRVGLWGEPFRVYKICSMRPAGGKQTNVTTSHDARITRFGHFIRRAKLDELPQLWNVLKGDMSFVGPRPDVDEVYTDLDLQDSLVLCLRPGITGLASVIYHDEEVQLAGVDDPETVYRTQIFPRKIRINKTYIADHSLLLDIRIMIATVLPLGFKEYDHV